MSKKVSNNTLKLITVLVVCGGITAHVNGSPIPMQMLTSSGQVVQKFLNANLPKIPEADLTKPIEVKTEVKNIEWEKILTQIKSELALQLVTINASGGLVVSTDETIKFINLPISSSKSSFGFDYNFNGNTTLDPSKITITEEIGKVVITLPPISLNLSEVVVKRKEKKEYDDLFGGKKVSIIGMPKDETFSPILLKLQKALNSSVSLQNKVHSDLLRTQEGQSILTRSQKNAIDFYQKLTEKIAESVIKGEKIKNPKEIQVVFQKQASFLEINIVGMDKKTVPALTDVSDKVLEEVKKDFEGEIKFGLSVKPEKVALKDPKELETTPTESKDSEGKNTSGQEVKKKPTKKPEPVDNEVIEELETSK